MTATTARSDHDRPARAITLGQLDGVDDQNPPALAADAGQAPGDGDAALVAAMLDQGVDPGALLGHGERPGVVRRIRELLGLSAADAPARASLDAQLADLTPAERLARVEALIRGGDDQVTGADLARARADVEVAQLRSGADSRKAAAARHAHVVAGIERAAGRVLDVLRDDDEDLAAATIAWQDCIRAARTAIRHAEAWQARVRPLTSSFTTARLDYDTGPNELIDEAAARCIAMSSLGADRRSFVAALNGALSTHRRTASMWSRLPVPPDEHA